MITSFRHDKRKSERRRTLLGALFIITLIIFFVRGSLSNNLGEVLLFVGRPLWSVEDAFMSRFSNFFALLHSKTQLAEENQRLHATLDMISLEALTRDQLRDENESLKSQLGRNPEYALILGRVLAAPPVSPYDTLIVDAGEEHGVQLDMDVLTDGDFKIGKVTRVWKRSSLVTLYSAPDVELSVAVGSSSIPAIARGTGGGNFRITLPRGVAVSVGNLVNIPALAPEYAGLVSAIDQPAGSSLENIFVTLPVNITQLKWVYFAKPVDDSATKH